jgi:putative tryptophan/tyrosine transport system substrate-binding protein
MRRREFIAGLGSAAAWAVVAQAQQPDRVRRIGVLMPGDENDSLPTPAFTQALAALGWTVGRNLRMDLRWDRDINRMRASTKELVSLQPDIIVTMGTTAVAAATSVGTGTIPIVFAGVGDPVASGIVARVDFGGNVSPGSPPSNPRWQVKWLELLSEVAPGLKRVAFMFNPDLSIAMRSEFIPPLEGVARSLKLKPIIAPVYTDTEIETAMIALGREPGGGLVVITDIFTLAHRVQFILGAARNNVPAVYMTPEFVRDGGLLSYGPDMVDIPRRAATYVDRILRGAKPGDLPVQFPTKFEMVVNLKTAKALGLTVPQSIMLRADEVIE